MFLRQKMCLLTAALILLSAFAGHAGEKITFGIPEWKGYTNSDGTGYYWDVLRDIYEYEGIMLIHRTAPFKRCIYELGRNEIEATAGMYRTPERLKKFVYPRSRISNEFSGMIFLRGTPFKEIHKLKGRIGIVRGYDYSAWLPANLDIYEVGTTLQGIRMLKAERISYHADNISLIESAIRESGAEKSEFVIKEIYATPLYALFTGNDRGQKMADIFDRGNRRLYKSGRLDELRKKYSIRKITYDSEDFEN